MKVFSARHCSNFERVEEPGRISKDMFYDSIAPVLVAERGGVEPVAAEAPTREVAAHEGAEAVRVAALQQVHHLVHDDVFEALRRLLGEL